MAVAAWGTALAAQPAARPPREIYNALNALRVDSTRTYYVKELTLRRDVVRMVFLEGRLAFLQAYDGRVLGAVFTGRGQVLAAPRDPIEKRSLARFLETPLLDQPFTRAYLRFTDHAAEELLQQVQDKKIAPLSEPAFGADWDAIVANLNTWHSLRALTELLSSEPRPYFYAGLLGDHLGPFDVMVDLRREEQVSLGQPKWVSGVRYYDSWASFARGDGNAEPWTPSFRAISYAVDTTIHPDRSLEGATLAEITPLREGERVITLELSRNLTVQSVADEGGRALEFFQNEELTRSQVSERGNDFVTVLLPEAARRGQPFRLRVRYRGTVISDAGNSVLFVGERGSWYAHLAGADQFVRFDLSFRWPRRLVLAATGERVAQGEEGEWRTGRWRSQQPVPIAGFNLGDYESQTVESGKVRIDVYANKQLEIAVLQRFVRTGPPPQMPRPPIAGPRTQASVQPRLVLPDPPAPTPAAMLKQLGAEIAEAVRFNEKFNGPFPFEHLAVAQIPGSFGQGWPGLLYLSTLSFLTPSQQSRAGIGQRIQEQFLDVVPAHEVAHQWWGNVVGWSSYRDQWINEGLANYLALVYADGKRPGENLLNEWLTLYRDDLVTAAEGADAPLSEAGPLVLGSRLRSSKAPLGYSRIVYGKGAWVFHMLRTMLRDPASKTPDARFTRLLAALLASHRHRALTTEDLRAAVEKVMTPAMDLERSRSLDWFFDQWVRGTEIPRYAVEFSVKPAANPANGFVLRGTLKQSGVPENFVASVPLYAPRASGKPALVGHVTTTGPETRFQFTVRSAPRKLLIDPHLTLLAVTD
jgi:hypothetical protein